MQFPAQFPVIGVLLALCACGSTTVPMTEDKVDADVEQVVTVDPIVATFGNGVMDVRYDPSTDRLIYSQNGTDLATIQRAPALDNRAFEGFFEPSSGYAGFRAVSASGASLVSIGSGSSAASFNVIDYQRLQTTALPTVGTATYSGDYVGVFTGGTANEPDNVVTGDVLLTADFAASQISGSITNRVTAQPNDLTPNPGEVATDLTIDPATINANGTFAGSASGGSFSISAGDPTPTSYSITEGIYQGAISGSTAGEVVGGIAITFIRDGSGSGPNQWRETGVFIASD